jgi:hypothetical protein
MSGGNNDATHFLVGGANCAYCAIGGLIGKGASIIMGDVYGQMGKPPPTGSSINNDGSMGFSLYNAKLTGKEIPEDGKASLEFQIEGITRYLLKKGCTVKELADMTGSKKYVKVHQAVAAVNKLPEGTLFLVLAGEDDFGSGCISTLAHWTLGQVQNGKGAYYDYQMKVGDLGTRRILAQQAKVAAATLSETGLTDKPVAAWGRELDEDDGLVRILVVAKD